MKRRILGILLCLCLVAGALPTNVFAASIVTTVRLTVEEPAEGKAPADTASLPSTASTEVGYVEWEGSFDENGCFVAGESYKVHIHVFMKTGMDKYFSTKSIYAYINGSTKKSEVQRMADDYIVVSETFTVGKQAATPTAKPTTGSGASGSEKAEDIPKTAVSVEDFKPGDYGTAKLKSTYIRIYDKPQKTNVNIVETIMKDAVVEIKAAYVLGEGVWPNYHVVSYNGKTGYAIVNDPAKGYANSFTDFMLEGNRPLDGTYAPLKQNETEKQREISSIAGFGSGFLLEPGKNPQIAYASTPLTVGMEHNGYYVDSISYTPDGPCVPYTRVTATVVYKAKDGYEFAETVKVASNYKRSFKRIDNKTVEAVYISFVGSDGTDIVTQPMLDYGKTHKEAEESGYAVVATGKMCAIDDYSSLQILNWPSMCSTSVTGKAGYNNKGKITKNIDILDLHAERRFAGVVGEWYLVSCANVVGFIPAAYVDDVKVTNYWDGAPGKLSETVPVFAGGSGTVEDPYLIETAEQLDAVRRGLGYSYKLIADIDLSGWGNWVPIGSNPAYGNGRYGDAQKEISTFTGTFDGNGHVISGMTIVDHRDDLIMTSQETSRVYALFASIDSYENAKTFGSAAENTEPRLKDLGIVNYTIDICYPHMENAANLLVAPFFGRCSSIVMENCYSAGGSINVAFGGEGGRIEVSGLGARMTESTVRNCYNTSPITVTDLDENREGFVYLCAAGICTATSFTWFLNCYNAGDITVSYNSASTSIAVGIVHSITPYDLRGIIGLSPDGSTVLYHCYNSGNMTASLACGLTGLSRSEVFIDDCYNVGKLTSDPNPGLGKSTMTAEYAAPGSALLKYGDTYLSKKNGVKLVSGDMWQNSAKLGRKVLKAIPEDAIKLPAKAEAVLMYECDVKDIPNQVYSGKAHTPAVTVSYKGKTLTEGKDYTVAYSKNVNPGRATATIYGLGIYKGTLGKSFAITPEKAKGLTGSSKGAKTATLNWTKDKSADGYIIEYSLDKNFKDAKKVTVTDKSTVTQRVSSLTSGKTYYFRICAYKTVSGKQAAGPYSDVITVKVK